MKTELSPTKPMVSLASGTPSTGKRDAHQWFDVGIIKATSCVVSHYHLPLDNGQNSDVSTSVQCVRLCKKCELLMG